MPKVSFPEMTPKIIYTSGTRHLYVTVKNAALLDNPGNWNLVARSVDGTTSRPISHEFISINDGVMDVALDDTVDLAPGSWYLQLEWTDAAVTEGVIQKEYQNQTASCLNFTVSEDVKYKNDSYGILTVTKYQSGGDFTYKIDTFRDETAFQAFQTAGGFSEILLIFRGEFSKSTYTLEDGGKRTYYTATSTSASTRRPGSTKSTTASTSTAPWTSKTAPCRCTMTRMCRRDRLPPTWWWNLTASC